MLLEEQQQQQYGADALLQRMRASRSFFVDTEEHETQCDSCIESESKATQTFFNHNNSDDDDEDGNASNGNSKSRKKIGKT